jgi:hypothetical protein
MPESIVNLFVHAMVILLVGLTVLTAASLLTFIVKLWED